MLIFIIVSQSLYKPDVAFTFFVYIPSIVYIIKLVFVPRHQIDICIKVQNNIFFSIRLPDLNKLTLTGKANLDKFNFPTQITCFLVPCKLRYPILHYMCSIRMLDFVKFNGRLCLNYEAGFSFLK